MKQKIWCVMVFCFCSNNVCAQWAIRSSTVDEPWAAQKNILTETYIPSLPCDIVVKSKQVLQHIDGWGGCFNELGWKALLSIDSNSRNKIMDDLYGNADGLKFTLGRIPVGANDYALNWYSYDENPDDFTMSKFSIQRDKDFLIHYIKSALSRNPSITFWASPWSPPTWMKVNKHYASVPGKYNDLPENRSVKSLTDQFILKPEYFKAYALYLTKFIQEYEKQGIDIKALHVQNEPFGYATYPGCVWTAKSLGTFIGKYLAPEFKQQYVKTDIWYGTINNGSMEGFEAALQNPKVNSVIKGVGIQWAGKNALSEFNKRFTKYNLMQTESECGDGSFDWKAAEHTFELIKFYLDNGVNSYMYWNLVLNNTGESSWGWKQNALITVNPVSKTVVYTPEYYLFKHISSFVGPGSVKISQEGPFENTLAFKNQDGRIVIIIHNPYNYAKRLTLKVDDQIIHVAIQPRSFNTVFSREPVTNSSAPNIR
jgi:glucosylceramidase